MITQIAEDINNAGGRAYFVGGYVWDMLLGIPCNDIDIEVFGLDYDTLYNILSHYGKLKCEGKSFQVMMLKVDGVKYDFSLPRKDSKVGKGHKEFVVEVDPYLTLEEAARRRDFTINSISLDILTNELYDPYSGIVDIQTRTLRATSEQFAEDPLRVLRGMQFCGRFNLINHDQDSLDLCYDLFDGYSYLSLDRIWGEWFKWVTKSIYPSLGLDFLLECGWLGHYPELECLIDLPQDPEYHPEGDVFTHTLLACDHASEIAGREGLGPEDTCVLVLSALCHDLGKQTTTYINEDNRVVSPGHAQETYLTEDFLNRTGTPNKIKDRVIELVREHMAHLNGTSNKVVRRLLSRLEHNSIDMLMFLIEADHSARPPLDTRLPEDALTIWEKAVELENQVLTAYENPTKSKEIS